MPSADDPALVVARFLKANNYTQTLDAFLQEAGLSQSSVSLNADDLTIEKILEEKRLLDASQAYEKRAGGDGDDDGDEDEAARWTTPAPTVPHAPPSLTPATSNVLCVRGDPSAAAASSSSSSSTSTSTSQRILATTADRAISLLSSSSSSSSSSSFDQLATLSDSDSPVLSLTFLDHRHHRYCLTTSMSGEVTARAGTNYETVVDRVRDHTKYAVGSAVLPPLDDDDDDDDDKGVIIATAGWDKNVHIYHSSSSSSSSTTTTPRFRFGKPIHTISLPTVPEALIFVRNPTTQTAYLVVSRRDSTYLYYYSVHRQRRQEGQEEGEEEGHVTPTKYTISEALPPQNLAPHYHYHGSSSSSSASFTPSCLAVHPSDPTLVAVATSHLPHMHLIIVRLLFPEHPDRQRRQQQQQLDDDDDDDDNNHDHDHDHAVGTSLVNADREEAAVLVHVATMAPQTPYSTPAVVWRPDGSGVFVNGDDGAVRGVEAKTGKVVVTLPPAAAVNGGARRGHEVGTKVRSLWCGLLDGREVLLSGGFDKRLVVWECGDS